MSTQSSAPLRILCRNEAETAELAARLGNALSRGLVIALNGQLGSGKTFLVRSMATALGADPTAVSSPTFVLMQIYPGTKLSICHFDTYRLADADEFEAIGALEVLDDPHFVCCIEWAERVHEHLPADRLEVTITQTSPEEREFRIHAGGPESAGVLARMQSDQ